MRLHVCLRLSLAQVAEARYEGAMQIWDITRTLSAELPPWPGDVQFSYKANGRMAEGGLVNSGSINMSLHNGTHCDAKFHFDDNGWTMEQAKLERYFGPAVVVDLSERYAGGEFPQIEIAQLENVEIQPRLLLKTGGWREPHVFPQRIPVLAPGVAEWMKSKGVTLLGLDVPSVDEIDAKELVNHNALGAADINIVESLELSAVAAGRYHFVALPLKIAGCDGSPLRAMLWRD
ncbi:arylformamidase [soil metagenome]